MNAGVTFAELLDYTDSETAKWKEFFGAHPAALDVRNDIQKSVTVSDVLLHIFKAEQFFAARISGVSASADSPQASLGDLFSIGAEARRVMRDFSRAATPNQWQETMELGRMGTPSRRKLMLQALTHSMRHWAQLATDLRRAGYPQSWTHDLIASDAFR